MKNDRFMPYPCSSGKLTIGYGHNIQDNGIKRKFADLILDDDIDDVIREVIARWPWIESLDETRQAVVINMGFMGVPRLATFSKFLAALKAKDFETAAVEMLDSKWAEQVKGRALRLAEQMQRGIFQ